MRVLCYSGRMKSPVILAFGLLPLCGFLAVASATAAGLEVLQGAWSAKQTNQEGQVTARVLEIQKDRLTFRIFSAEGDVRFFAKGDVAVQNLGPFQALRITGIRAGRSEDAAEPIDDERTSVFVVDGDTLTLASNFDKARAGQLPRAETYSRGKATAKLEGTWKMDVQIGENDMDYELRLSEADGKFAAALVSPRSGEHKFRQVTWAGEKLVMELDREYDGNSITLIYTGKLGADGLSGSVVAKGAEDQFSGTWKARK